MNSKQTNAWQLKVFPILTILGWILIVVSLLVGLVLVSPTASAYWGGNPKVVRDGAEIGSRLLGQLGTLTTTPHWLEPLTFVGVASFMVGIALAFSSIPGLLNNRGQIMSVCFPYLVENKNK